MGIGKNILGGKPTAEKYPHLEREILPRKVVEVSHALKQLNSSEIRIRQAEEALSDNEGREVYGEEKLQKFLEVAQNQKSQAQEVLMNHGFQSSEEAINFLREHGTRSSMRTLTTDK